MENIRFRNVTLEMSLKPFYDDSKETMESICLRLFTQWQLLWRHSDVVSILLWVGDGSEIMEYDGNLGRTFEWAKYIGVANPRWKNKNPNDPENISIHRHPYLYRENPPEFTYQWLKDLVNCLKVIGRQLTGKTIRVGATFDPGPEFAKSSFKYEKHPEICMGNTLSTVFGNKSFVCCYSTFKKDKYVYAGFPDGIPEGLSFGSFLGRQTQCFAKELDFDYLWLSNGFGFGLEAWGCCGSIFDGELFATEKCNDVKNKIIQFWKCFRKECPDLSVETRGTNLSTGMHLSSDASPLQDIYRGNYGIEPPPNSPWAALSGDFGMELTGWMSHIAELPDESFPFRFYTHDPWFLNSPWLDRYCREPHDIYLPLSVCRINDSGQIKLSDSIEILTVDNSYGEMPEMVPNEVIPYILDAKSIAPDSPGPFIWVYPFQEYHNMVYSYSERIKEVFFGDWFMRAAINNGLPINTVISSSNFIANLDKVKEKWKESVFVIPTTLCDSKFCSILSELLAKGVRIVLYGSLENTDKSLLKLLNLDIIKPLSDILSVILNMETDFFVTKGYPNQIKHTPIYSSGGIDTVISNKNDRYTKTLAYVEKDGEKRIAALGRLLPEWKLGELVWVRGTNSFTIDSSSQSEPHMLDTNQYFYPEILMRLVLSEFGYRLLVSKDTLSQKNPVNTVHRNQNAFYFSGYVPDTTVTQYFRFPQGSPVFLGLKTRLIDGCSTYTMPRSWHHECRVFIEQEKGVISCQEFPSVMPGVKRRFMLYGLDNAIVRFYPEPRTENNVKMLRNPVDPFLTGDFVKTNNVKNYNGNYLESKNISGELLISW